MAARLTVLALAVLALLGSVSCQQGGNGDGNPAPAPPPQRNADPPIQPQPPASPPTTSRPPSYPPTSSSPPPSQVPTYSPPSPSSSPLKVPHPPAYPPSSSSSPLPPSYPPTSPSPPPPKVLQPPTYPPPSPSPPSPILPPPSPPQVSQSPTYPPVSPSPPPPLLPPPSPSPPPTIYPPVSPSPPPPMLPPPSPSPPPPMLPPPSPSPSPPQVSQPPTYPSMSPSPPPPSPSSDGAGDKFKIGYYKNKCRVDVEAIIRKHVSSFNDGMKAGLIRLLFHDCFVRGCDASILLDPTSDNQQPEKLGIPNLPSLRSYEVIDAAKAELEAVCPGVVSCADIVAFAARDASYFLSGGGIKFEMPAGRYDGSVSLASETLPNLPPPFAGLLQLEKMFAAKGLNSFDMVALSGAHSVGRYHCSSFSRDRLPPSTSDMDPAFAVGMQANCTSANGAENTVVGDHETPDVLDNQYYQNVLDRKVLLTSDAALTSKDMTNYLVRMYAMFPWLWQQKFEQAMVKMSLVEVKTAATGEIRRTCRAVNSKP